MIAQCSRLRMAWKQLGNGFWLWINEIMKTFIQRSKQKVKSNCGAKSLSKSRMELTLSLWLLRLRIFWQLRVSLVSGLTSSQFFTNPASRNGPLSSSLVRTGCENNSPPRSSLGCSFNSDHFVFVQRQKYVKKMRRVNEFSSFLKGRTVPVQEVEVGRPAILMKAINHFIILTIVWF